jgi:hypothetical protein
MDDLLLPHEVRYMIENETGWRHKYEAGTVDVYPYENAATSVVVRMKERGNYLISALTNYEFTLS